MSYEYHLALAETDVSSRNFCNLIDAAVMLYEEEHRDKGKSKCHTKTTPSEKEESDKMSFLHNFRRKRRSSVVNFNGASTSSSLVELNTISVNSNPRNPLQWLPSSSSSSSLLNLNTLAAHLLMETQQNPPSSSTLLVEDNTPELEKKEMKTNPPNPRSQPCKTNNTKRKRRAVQERKGSNTPGLEKKETTTNPPNPNSHSCKTKNTKRKRRAVQERNRSTSTGSVSKKPKVAPPYSWKGKEAPEWLVQLIKDMEEHEGRASELIRSCLGPSVSEAPRLIFEKTLTKTDLRPGQSRLLMPFNTLVCNDFLKPVELRILEEVREDGDGVGAILVDKQKAKWGFVLNKWYMKKASGNGTVNYALICGWNDIVKGNELKIGSVISIWSFRLFGLLCFALVLPPLTD